MPIKENTPRPHRFASQSEAVGVDGARTTYYGIDRETALCLSKVSGRRFFELLAASNAIRTGSRGNKADLCSIINAKSGSCPEDCSFCAQSAHSRTNAQTYDFLAEDRILESAVKAKGHGVKRFCIVTSGRNTSDKDINRICSLVSRIRDMGLLPCATLGMLNISELKALKDAGLHRYHHNLETSEAFFKEICTTHTYRDKIDTIESAKALGLSICSGGIFGLGESWEDRIDMAFALKEIGVDSIPINFLSPVTGTPLGSSELLDPIEALKIIAVYRHILPEHEIRVCGGRPVTLKDLNSYIFLAGADGLLIGDYLTTPGRNFEDDLQMIKELGMEI